MEKFAIGIDLGGTKLEASIVSDNGRVADRMRIATNAARSADMVIADMIDVIQTLIAKDKNIVVSAIGVGVAGQIDRHTGSVIYAPNLKWHNVPLKEQLSAHFKIPVAVCNDVRAAAWGEWLSGAGQGCDNLVCIFVGTGVGGAIVCNGQMLSGHNNTAGEIGHIIASPNGPQCTCGNKGCLEAIAGGWAIKRDAQQLAQSEPAYGSMLLDLAAGHIDAITAATVVKAALAGDAAANSLMENVANVLTAAITSIINVIGPQQVILGGGIVEGMPLLIDKIRTGVKKNALHAAIDNVAITPTHLQNKAGAIGAAFFALKSAS